MWARTALVAPALALALALTLSAAAGAQPFGSLSCTRSATYCVAVSPAGSATTYAHRAWSRPAVTAITPNAK